MIVEKLNQVTFDRVLKESDAKQVLSVENMLKHARLESEQILQSAKQEAAEIKRRAYDETVKQLTDGNDKDLQDFEQKFAHLLANLQQNIYTIMDKILIKLGADKIDANNFKRIINQELCRFTDIEILKVQANSRLIDKLQQEFACDVSKIEFSWVVDEELTDEECICSTNLWNMRLNFATAKDVLKKLLPERANKELIEDESN